MSAKDLGAASPTVSSSCSAAKSALESADYMLRCRRGKVLKDGCAKVSAVPAPSRHPALVLAVTSLCHRQLRPSSNIDPTIRLSETSPYGQFVRRTRTPISAKGSSMALHKEASSRMLTPFSLSICLILLSLVPLACDKIYVFASSPVFPLLCVCIDDCVRSIVRRGPLHPPCR